MQLYNKLKRKVNKKNTPCLKCKSLKKKFKKMQNNNNLSLFIKILRTNNTQIYSKVSKSITYTIQYVQNINIVKVSLPSKASKSITNFKSYYQYNFIKYIKNINACNNVFSKYCFNNKNISVQPKQINTPKISNLNSNINLSSISFIQRKTNQALKLKYAPVNSNKYCLLKAILVLKQHNYS